MQGFHYLLLNLHNHDPIYTGLINQIFELWEHTFAKVARQNESALDPDEFFRSHYIGALMYDEEIVGFNLFTNFDLSLISATRHRYFQSLGACSPERLSLSKVKKVMTMEYFTITPAWRKQMKDAPWGEILTGMGLKFLDNSGADAILGTPRIDLKVHEMCYRLGAYDFQAPVERLNYKCAVVLFPKSSERKFENPLTQRWVKKLTIAESPGQVPVLPLKESA